MTEVEALRAENAALRSRIDELVKQIAEFNERLDVLLAAAQRKHRPPPPPKPPSPPPTLDAHARDAFEGRPKAQPKPEEPPRQRGPRKPSGRKAVPQHLEAETHTMKPEVCEHCGSTALDAAGEVIEEKLHVVKEHQRRRVVRRTMCRCRDCGGRTTPRSLPSPYPRSKVTGEWLAWFLHQKFVMLVPLDRIRRDLADRNIPIAMGTMVSFIERAADLLARIDGLHWKQLLESEWMATDGTGLEVLVPGLPEAHNGYIELYRNLELAVFHYESDKAGETVKKKLAAFVGTLTADAEHRFNGVFVDGQVIEAGCNAHGRRKFRDAEATQPVLAAEGGAFIGAIYGEEERAAKLKLSGPALLEHRQTHMRPIVEEFERWLAAVEPTLLPSEPLAQAVRYYRRHRDALFRFLEDPVVPLDKSATEREFQPVAKLRLNMLFAGSTEGAHRACIILGIVATCRAIGVSFQAYLVWFFERAGTHRDIFALNLKDLTPAAFKKTLA